MGNSNSGYYHNLAQYYSKRGNVYLDIEKYQKAIDDFNDAIRFSNNENEKAQYYDWRAKAHYENGDIKRYREDLEKAADLYQQQGKTTKYQTAMEQLEKNQEQE